MNCPVTVNTLTLPCFRSVPDILKGRPTPHFLPRPLRGQPVLPRLLRPVPISPVLRLGQPASPAVLWCSSLCVTTACRLPCSAVTASSISVRPAPDKCLVPPRTNLEILSLILNEQNEPLSCIHARSRIRKLSKLSVGSGASSDPEGRCVMAALSPPGQPGSEDQGV